MCKTRTAYANTKHSTEDVIVDEERGEEEGDKSEYYNIVQQLAHPPSPPDLSFFKLSVSK